MSPASATMVEPGAVPAPTALALGQEILRRLRRLLGESGSAVPLHAPSFEGRELEYVTECITTGWVSSVGKFVDRFERDLACYTGAAHAVALVNGTCALNLALHLVGVQAGEEVLMPALTFVATANATAHLGAVPHFVDVEESTLGLDPDALTRHLAEVAVRQGSGWINRLTGRRIAAVVPMHTFGHAVRLGPLVEIAARYDLPVVEDAAESVGSTYRGRHTGRWGRLGILSFNGNKTITTGGGGAILTDDPELARRAKHLSTTAKLPHRWAFHHDAVGFNYRMPNLNAALGCAQLERLPVFLDRKRRLAAAYETTFAGLDEVRFAREPADCCSNYWLCTLVLRERHAGHLDTVLGVLNDAGFMTRPVWALLSTLPMYREAPRGSLTVSESLACRILSLPSSPSLAHWATT